MQNWHRKNFSDLFVADGESTSYSFTFEDGTEVSFSSQIYPEFYSRKLSEIKEIIEQYKTSGTLEPGLVPGERNPEEAAAIDHPDNGRVEIEVCQYSKDGIHRLMNELDISSARKRAYKATTNSKHSHPIAPNLLARRFSFDKPVAWIGDITDIPTDEGWIHCAVVKDFCAKQIVGCAFSDRIDTSLTLVILIMTLRRRQPAPGLIVHSARGVQYVA